jgi:PAS domain S-box-containing protein
LWEPGAAVVQWLLFAFLLSVPAAFVAGLVRTRLATAGASRFLIEAPPTPEAAQAGLRRALGDPGLQLAYWLPERGAYVDTDGNPFVLPPDGGGRMTTPIAYGDRPVAALVHDESLRREPELVEAVVAAARVTLERDRLAAELRARLDELQRERDFVATVVNTAPALFCVVDLDGRIVRFNATGERWTGLADADAVRGRTFWDAFVVPAERDAVRRRLLAAAGALEPTPELETDIRGAGGEVRVLAWSSTPIVDAQGRQRLLIAGSDVTERARHAFELQRERDVLNTIADTAASLMLIVDERGRLTGEGQNASARRALGRADEEVVGLDFVEVVVAPEDAARARAHFERSVAARSPRELDSTWVARSGERLRVAWSATWLARSDDDAHDLFLVCGADVTDRMRQEDELRASRARIVEAADAERRRLERNLHDGAQQRLVTLALTLRLVESRIGGESAGAELLRAARDELGQALDELRDLARGIHPAVLSDHGLAAALDALATRTPLPVRLDRLVGERLPEPVEVAAYYVVSEALANVQKYADASEVRIAVGREDGLAVVEVRDDGVGGASASGGSGLRGLADRVEALGGRLELESPAGAGTTVRARIPC